MSKKMLTPLNLLTRASDPSSGIEGDVYFNTSEMVIKVHNGITFVAITATPTNSLPFYEHTHGPDGEVNSVMPIPLTEEELGDMGLLVLDDGTIDKAQTVQVQSADDGTVSTPSQDFSDTLDGGTI